MADHISFDTSSLANAASLTIISDKADQDIETITYAAGERVSGK